MAKNGAQVLAQELLDIQQGSIEDAMMLLFDADFGPAAMQAVEKAIHELGDPSYCECGSEYDRRDSLYNQNRAMMKALDDIHYYYGDKS